MRTPRIFLCLLLGLCAAACSRPETRAVESGAEPATPTAHDDDEAEEVEVPLDQLPEAVKAAALAAVPGIVLEEAEMELENGITIYDVEGELDGVEYEIEVSADGVVHEIEQESAQDGDDDEADGDDEHDDD